MCIYIVVLISKISSKECSTKERYIKGFQTKETTDLELKSFMLKQ